MGLKQWYKPSHLQASVKTKTRKPRKKKEDKETGGPQADEEKKPFYYKWKRFHWCGFVVVALIMLGMLAVLLFELAATLWPAPEPKIPVTKPSQEEVTLNYFTSMKEIKKEHQDAWTRELTEVANRDFQAGTRAPFRQYELDVVPDDQMRELHQLKVKRSIEVLDGAWKHPDGKLVINEWQENPGILWTTLNGKKFSIINMGGILELTTSMGPFKALEWDDQKITWVHQVEKESLGIIEWKRLSAENVTRPKAKTRKAAKKRPLAIVTWFSKTAKGKELSKKWDEWKGVTTADFQILRYGLQSQKIAHSGDSATKKEGAANDSGYGKLCSYNQDEKNGFSRRHKKSFIYGNIPSKGNKVYYWDAAEGSWKFSSTKYEDFEQYPKATTKQLREAKVILPGGFECGDAVYSLEARKEEDHVSVKPVQPGNMVAKYEKGVVKGLGDDGELEVMFSKLWDVTPDSIKKMPTLPGGLKVGDKVYATWAWESERDDDNDVGFNEEGVVRGPSTGGGAEYLNVLFSGTKGWNVKPKDISKDEQVDPGSDPEGDGDESDGPRLPWPFGATLGEDPILLINALILLPLMIAKVAATCCPSRRATGTYLDYGFYTFNVYLALAVISSVGAFHQWVTTGDEILMDDSVPGEPGSQQIPEADQVTPVPDADETEQIPEADQVTPVPETEQVEEDAKLAAEVAAKQADEDAKLAAEAQAAADKQAEEDAKLATEAQAAEAAAAKQAAAKAAEEKERKKKKLQQAGQKHRRKMKEEKERKKAEERREKELNESTASYLVEAEVAKGIVREVELQNIYPGDLTNIWPTENDLMTFIGDNIAKWEKAGVKTPITVESAEAWIVESMVEYIEKNFVVPRIVGNIKYSIVQEIRKHSLVTDDVIHSWLARPRNAKTFKDLERFAIESSIHQLKQPGHWEKKELGPETVPAEAWPLYPETFGPHIYKVMENGKTLEKVVHVELQKSFDKVVQSLKTLHIDKAFIDENYEYRRSAGRILRGRVPLPPAKEDGVWKKKGTAPADLPPMVSPEEYASLDEEVKDLIEEQYTPPILDDYYDGYTTVVGIVSEWRLDDEAGLTTQCIPEDKDAEERAHKHADEVERLTVQLKDLKEKRDQVTTEDPK